MLIHNASYRTLKTQKRFGPGSERERASKMLFCTFFFSNSSDRYSRSVVKGIEQRIFFKDLRHETLPPWLFGPRNQNAAPQRFFSSLKTTSTAVDSGALALRAAASHGGCRAQRGTGRAMATKDRAVFFFFKLIAAQTVTSSILMSTGTVQY